MKEDTREGLGQSPYLIGIDTRGHVHRCGTVEGRGVDEAASSGGEGLGQGVAVCRRDLSHKSRAMAIQPAERTLKSGLKSGEQARRKFAREQRVLGFLDR